MDTPNNNNNSLPPNGKQKEKMATQNVVDLDPKRLKRLQMNREYAKRSHQKKQDYVQQLRKKIEANEAKIAFLSPLVASYHSRIEELKRENEILRLKVEELEREAIIEDACTSELKMEIELLRKLEEEKIAKA